MSQIAIPRHLLWCISIYYFELHYVFIVCQNIAFHTFSYLNLKILFLFSLYISYQFYKYRNSIQFNYFFFSLQIPKFFQFLLCFEYHFLLESLTKNYFSFTYSHTISITHISKYNRQCCHCPAFRVFYKSIFLSIVMTPVKYI
jgi:hypothetical protein